MKNPQEYQKLSKGEKHIIDWQIGIASGWRMALQELISLSDLDNLAKLELAFPDEVQAFKKYRNEIGWWAELANRVGVNE
jgi:hypothetical protein